VPFAGRGMAGMQDLGTLGGDYSWAWGVSADGRIVVVGLEALNRSYAAPGQLKTLEDLVPFAGRLGDGGMQDGSTLVYLLLTPLLGAGLSVAGWHGAVLNAVAEGLSWPGRLFGRWQRSWQGRCVGEAYAFRCLSLRTRVGCAGSGHAGRILELQLTAFPPTAPWWSAGLTTPLGQYHAFRWTASGGHARPRHTARWQMIAIGLGCFRRWLAVVVGYANNAEGQWRAFRWTASGGMQDHRHACELGLGRFRRRRRSG
jgi:uncharacterized membrane protein